MATKKERLKEIFNEELPRFIKETLREELANTAPFEERFPDAITRFDEEDLLLLDQLKPLLIGPVTRKELFEARAGKSHEDFEEIWADDLFRLAFVIEQGHPAEFTGCIYGGKKFLKHILHCPLCQKMLVYHLYADPSHGDIPSLVQ